MLVYLVVDITLAYYVFFYRVVTSRHATESSTPIRDFFSGCIGDASVAPDITEIELTFCLPENEKRLYRQIDHYLMEIYSGLEEAECKKKNKKHAAGVVTDETTTQVCGTKQHLRIYVKSMGELFCYRCSLSDRHVRSVYLELLECEFDVHAWKIKVDAGTYNNYDYSVFDSPSSVTQRYLNK